MVIKMIIYEWNKQTKFYIGSYNYAQPPMGKMTLTNATVTAPDFVNGKLCKWQGDELNGKWITVDDVWNKICWDGEKFAVYKNGSDFPICSRVASKDEVEKLKKPTIWAWKNKDGNPVWESPDATDEAREAKKAQMNKSCQNWVLKTLDITILDEILCPEKKKLADDLAKSVDKQWDKYLKQIKKAKTLIDLDFDFIWD